MSFSLNIPPHQRAAARLIGSARAKLLDAVIQAEKKDGINRAEIARRLGKDRALITRKLSGSSDLTLRSIAEISWAIGVKPEINFIPVSVPGSHQNETTASWRIHAPRLATTSDLPPHKGLQKINLREINPQSVEFEVA